MIEVLIVFGKAVAMIFIFMYGMLSAFFPINDKETSKEHRAFWLIITTLAIIYIGGGL